MYAWGRFDDAVDAAVEAVVVAAIVATAFVVMAARVATFSGVLEGEFDGGCRSSFLSRRTRTRPSRRRFPFVTKVLASRIVGERGKRM